MFPVFRLRQPDVPELPYKTALVLASRVTGSATLQ